MFECVQLGLPHRLEVPTDGAEGCAVCAVIAVAAFATNGDEVRVGEDAQVLRYATEGDAEFACDVAGAFLLGPDKPQDIPPPWLADNLEDIYLSGWGRRSVGVKNHEDILVMTKISCKSGLDERRLYGFCFTG